ncbi:MAG: DUF4386 family protein [Novosphingobium sp.]|nr:DUF4386 family protein [Novosphingobium sp.]
MTRTETHALVMLTLGQVVIFLIPLVVLGQAIGWPASLRLPASEALPLIAGKAIFVQIGYWGYLLTAVAMVPFVIALRRLASAHGAGGLLADTMAAFGVAAAVLKTLGIVRWLIGMPALADLYANTSDPVVRVMIEVSYVTLNSYAGSIGELLGVQLLSGMWLVLLGLIFRQIGFRLNGLAAIVIGLGFALASLRTIEPALGLLGAILPPIALVWLLALAVTVWRKA